MCEINRLVQIMEAPANDEAVAAWLTSQMNAERPFLLAYADDGVIWGRWIKDRLRTAYEVAKDTPSAGISTELRGPTLQQAFVFGPADEVRLFKDEDEQWQARQIVEIGQVEFIEESQILVGDQVINSLSDHFTHVEDRRGLSQIVPFSLTSADLQARRLRLTVRYFFDYEPDSGEAYLGLTRLVNAAVVPEVNEEVQS